MEWDNFKEKFNRFNTAFDISKNTGYYFNKWIFRSAILLMILLWVYIAWTLNWDFSAHIYISCPNQSTCHNPFIDTLAGEGCNGQPICYNAVQHPQFKHSYDDLSKGINKFKYPGIEEELLKVKSYNPILQRGETRGTKPPVLVQYYVLICLIVLAVAFLINHLIYNKNFKYKGDYDINE